MTEICIPYKGYWCTPFARWQGSLAHLHSVRFAAHVAKKALNDKAIPLDSFDYGVLGLTIPQQNCFYGLPWLAGLIGADNIGGPTISQACATSTRVLACAADEISALRANCVLTVTTDRTSNGPHIYYPDPTGPGGTGRNEDWVLGNFSHDPLAHCDMTHTAENCASKWGVSLAEQHELVLRRYEQYQDATRRDNGSSFHEQCLMLPFAVPDKSLRKTTTILNGDEGIYHTTREALDRLKPVKEGGTVTYGAQTYPADGCAGMIVTTADKAKELSKDPDIHIQILAFGQSRTDLAYMPAAAIVAASKALDVAGINIADIKAIKSHNPFAVNDIIFAREIGIDVNNMNNFGCSLIWGHPQGPTGMRAIIELIEELVLKGGGYGLFHGCAAGDTAMAVVLRVR